tara:strand:+ start:1357 stop:1992 length:636 start_codon:yes stop_codon:yes gene_type:complete
MNIRIKPFTLKDEAFLLKLRNQKSIRFNSTNRAIIGKNDHKIWIRKFVKNKNNKIYIIYLSSKKIGYIRLDNLDFFNFISIAIIENFQEKGYAYESLIEFEKYFKSNKLIISKIKSNNMKSIALFKKTGYLLINKSSNFLYFCKIYKSRIYINKSLKIINEIEKVRKNNNINWMDILRLSFQSNLEVSKSIFKKITVSDKKINLLSKKLSK